ncbi:hypothetical protein [Streptomyces rubradiris]|uniref:Integral membrane protein n=1 Tax=Streptomyces rubradiris TaxID=285531 RepID=A0ABQ3RGQ5_STRRR|nr:hypothetical protein [Streptomyces rubradiris]GHH22301.1 hypothetical protein GCM10018792_57840 [Streptomyces rubradiris]GHI55034.1 hypothetical protein Srubr_48800 [Streptomyces rubradiris]
MLALRLTRAARPAVQLRRLLVAAASAGTGLLLLSSLGRAVAHPEAAGAAALRLAWCAAPLAATVYLALAVARTDPGTRPRPGLSALGLGPARLMAVSALTTALSCSLGSLLALLFFLHLRGDLTGLPFDGAAAGLLAAGHPLPVPAAVTLLTLLPVTATAAVAVALRPRDPLPPARAARRFGRFGALGGPAGRETFGAYGRFGTRLPSAPGSGQGVTAGDGRTATDGDGRTAAAGDGRTATAALLEADGDRPAPDDVPEPPVPDPEAGSPAGLPWGIALVTAGLAAQAYAGRSAPALAVLLGWLLTGSGLVLAGPGLTHLCGRLLQAGRPGALRLLAGRGLMAEAARIGRPLGVVCAVASAGCALAALTALSGGPAPARGPLSALGALVVGGSTLATLLTAAVEARQYRAGTTAALLRLGARPALLRGAAALRAAALPALFGPLVLAIAALSALPLSR